MRKIAMINSIKDSFVLLIMSSICFGIFVFVKNSYGNTTTDIIMLVLVTIAAIYVSSILAALGASLLFGNSYTVNKEKYTIRVAVLNEDKRSSFFHTIKVMFFATIGMFFYPLAVLVTILNLKDLFAEDSKYEAQTKIEKIEKEESDMLDITIKGSKKWKIHLDAFTDYYFESSDDALDYALKNGIDTRLVEKV